MQSGCKFTCMRFVFSKSVFKDFMCFLKALLEIFMFVPKSAFRIS